MQGALLGLKMEVEEHYRLLDLCINFNILKARCRLYEALSPYGAEGGRWLACPVRVAFCSGFMLGRAAAQTCRR